MPFRRLGQRALKAAPILGLRRGDYSAGGFLHQAKTLTRLWRSRYIGRSCAVGERCQRALRNTNEASDTSSPGVKACLFGLA